MTIANPYLHGKDPDNAGHLSLKRWAAIASLSTATLLVTVKFFAFMATDSVSILSSLMDSSFDGVASLVTMASIAHAATPADHDHRFGHGKVEALSALAQAVFILGSALFLLFESLHRFITPVMVKQTETGVYTIVFSIVLTGALIMFQHYVIKKTSSVAIRADHMHYKGDLFMNLGVFCALVLSHYSHWPYFDPIFAALTALVLLSGVRGIGREALDVLMDREIPEADRQKILDIAASHNQVRAIHDLRTRSTGTRIFIEFHMEMNGSMRLKAAHDVTEEVEKKLYDAFPTAEVIIHQEPAGIDDHRLDDIIEGGQTPA